MNQHQTERLIDAADRLRDERKQECHTNWAKEDEMNERFTIEEIAEYITGWHLSTESGALANALSQLRDDQDGILAVRERNKARHAIHQFLHNSQDHSSQKD